MHTRFRRAVLGCLLGLALSGAIPAAAVEAPPRPPASAIGLIRDMRLTVLARRALAEDRDLAPYRLGVEVREGIATVWGDVPSDAVSRKARERLQAISGIHGVRSDLIAGSVQKRELAELSVPSRVPPRIVVEAAKPDPRTGAIRKRQQAVVVGGDVPRAVKPGDLPDPRAQPLPEEKPQRAVVLLPPSAVRRDRAEAARDEAEAQPGETLSEAVERVRASDRRFRFIPVEVSGGTVIIGRGDEEGVTALREALRRVRGVREVVLSGE